MCSLCPCAEFMREEADIFDAPQAFVVDDEDEMEIPGVEPLDFDEDAER
jgi:hypothetical protein